MFGGFSNSKEASWLEGDEDRVKLYNHEVRGVLVGDGGQIRQGHVAIVRTLAAALG